MHNKKLVIGLTGGIASGKSQVSSYFLKLGVEVIDADQIARNLFAVGSPHLATLRQHFGDKIFNSNGSLNRKILGEIVFSQPEELAWLNSLTHPLISQAILGQLKHTQSLYVVLDIPLLVKLDGNIPNYLKNLIDRVLVVQVDESKQITRVIERDKISLQQVERILANQASPQQRLAVADDIIDNNASLESLSDRVQELHKLYLTMLPKPVK